MKTFSELTESVFDDTLAFIKKAHAGQTYGSKPYWTHPLEVAKTGKKLFGSKFTDSAYKAALLHDVIEDTPYDRSQLEQLGYSKEILDTVDLVTKVKGITYEENINRIVQSGNKLAMMVKLADNIVNYNGDKSSWPEEKRLKSQEKYRKSIEALSKKLGIKPQI